MSVKEDKVNLIITINGDKARKELNALDKEARTLKEEMKGLNKESEEYINKSKRLNEVEDRMKALRAEIGLNAKTLKELNMELRSLTAARQYLQPGTDAFARNEAQIKAVRGRITELNAGIRDTGGMLNVVKNEIRQFGLIAASYLGLQFLGQQITNIISKAGKLSDQLADVAKTTGMSKAEVQALNSELSKMDTRTSTTELRNIAVVAGQLGIAKEEVAGFVESIDKANVALGDEFTGGAQDVAQTLGKLRNVFSDVKSQNVDEDLLRIGNALNELGAAGAATGPVVADFANRIGGVGISLGLTSSEVLGLSATLQELNVNTERGGTAVVRILQKMTTDTEEFAKVANMDLKDFTELVNRDLFAAFQRVVQGVNAGGASATEFSKILDSLGVDGAGASEVISKLAGNMPLLTEKVDLAGKAIQNTDSITNEVSIKNETLGAQLDKLGKKFFAFATSDGIKNFLAGAVEKTSSFLDWLGKVPEFISENVAAFRLLAAGVVAYNAALISARLSAIASTTVERILAATYEIGFKWMLLQENAKKAYAVTTDLLTGKITLAAAAQRAWNFVIALNPVALIIGSLFALIEVVDLYRRNTAEALALEKQKLQLSKDIEVAQNNLTGATKAYSDQLQQVNLLTPVAREQLQKLMEAKLQDAEATLTQLRAEQQRVKEASTQLSTWQAVWNMLKNAADPARAAVDKVTTAMENGKEAAEKYNDPLKKLEDTINGLRDKTKQLSDINNAFSNAMKIQTSTTEQYNEKLRLLRIALNNAAVDSNEYKKILAEIKKTQDELAAKSGDPLVNSDSLEEARKKAEELNNELKKLELDVLKGTRSQMENDVAAINQKYAELEQRAAGNQQALQRIANLKAAELLAIERKFNLETEQLRNSLYNSRLSKEEQELQAIRKFYDDKIAAVQGYHDKVAELEKLRDEALALKTAEQNQKRIERKVQIEDEIWLLQQSSNDREIIEEARKWESLIADAEAAGLNTTGLYEMMRLAIQSIQEQQILDEKARKKRAADDQVRMEREKWQKVSDVTQSGFQAISNMLMIAGTNQATMIEFQKMAAFTQTSIAAAVATAEAIRAAATGSLTGFDLIAKIGSAVAAITAAILSAKNMLSSAQAPAPPQLQGFEKGGRLPGGTVLPGPESDRDNLVVYDPVSGQPVATVKSGEPILSTETYENNKPVVDALLDASMNRGGAAISLPGVPAFEEGGLLDRPLTVPIMPNTDELLNSIRIDRFGPLSVSLNTGAPGADGGSSGSAGANTEQLLQAHRDMIDKMLEQNREFMSSLEVKGVWDWDYDKRTRTRMEEIENASSGR